MCVTEHLSITLNLAMLLLSFHNVGFMLLQFVIADKFLNGYNPFVVHLCLILINYNSFVAHFDVAVHNSSRLAAMLSLFAF